MAGTIRLEMLMSDPRPTTMSPLPIKDERVRAAALEISARLATASDAFTGAAYTQAAYRAFLDVFDEVEAEHGRDEAHHIMGEVALALSAALDVAMAPR